MTAEASTTTWSLTTTILPGTRANIGYITKDWLAQWVKERDDGERTWEILNFIKTFYVLCPRKQYPYCIKLVDC